MRAISPALAWSDETYLLARCEYILRCVAWMFSEDGSRGVNRPKPMRTPAEIAENRETLESALAFDESGDFLQSILPEQTQVQENIEGVMTDGE